MPVSLARPSVRSRAVAVGAGALAALVVWILAVPVLGVDLAVAQGGATQAVGVVAVIVTPVLAGLLGWALLALLESRARHGRRIWIAVAVVIVLLSVVGPITSATNTAAAITLTLMHLVVATVVIPGLTRSAR